MSRTVPNRRTADDVLPGVNVLVRLTIGATTDPDDPPLAANVPSRIEDVVLADPRVKGSRTQLYVAVPRYPGDVDVPRPGTACTVTWVTSDGLYDLPAGFVERVVVGPVVWAWRVEVSGRAVRAQRRRYVRVSWTAPVVLDVVPVVRLNRPVDGTCPVDGVSLVDGADAEGDAVHGTTLDLSEGGIRCLLPLPPLPTGQLVRVHLKLEGDQLTLEGTVIRVRVAARAPGAPRQCETGIAFTEPDRYGDLLRKVVFGEQRRVRRSGLG
jgi:hypothetical protein